MPSYFLTLETSHGPVRAAWELGAPIKIFMGADEQPETQLGSVPETLWSSDHQIWTELATQTTGWLRAHTKDLEIHGVTRSRRQASSLSELLDDLNLT